MPRKTKNRSSKQAKQDRQAKTFTARQDRAYEAAVKATHAALAAVGAADEFRVKNGDDVVVVNLEDIRQNVNANLVPMGENPWLDTTDQVADMLRSEIEMDLVLLHPDGLWRMPEEYLSKAEQA
jgi:hypothetical protein